MDLFKRALLQLEHLVKDEMDESPPIDQRNTTSCA